MPPAALLSLALLTVAALSGGAGRSAVDAAAAPSVASTTSTAAPARGLTVSRWRLGASANRSPEDGKVGARVVQTAPLPEVGLGVSGVGDALTGTKLAMAQKLLEHPLIAKILRPILDFVGGTGGVADATGGELLNPSYFGSSFSFPFAFRSNFFKNGNGTAEPSDTSTDSSNNEATSGDSTEVRDAKAVRPGGEVQHYRLAVAKRGRPSAPMPAP